MLHQVRMLERVGVDFQVVFHWGCWTLCPEIQPKRRLSLFLHSQYAELLIPEAPITIQVQRIEDLLCLLLTHSHSQLVTCLDEVVQRYRVQLVVLQVIRVLRVRECSVLSEIHVGILGFVETLFNFGT